MMRTEGWLAYGEEEGSSGRERSGPDKESEPELDSGVKSLLIRGNRFC